MREIDVLARNVPFEKNHALPVGVAVVGAGHWGKNLVRAFNTIGCLAAVCDYDPPTRHTLENEYPGCTVADSYDDILGKPCVGAVAIATPAELHADMVRKALLAGKDVFVEKPLCLSVGTARELVRMADSLGRILMVGHLLWYHPAILRLKQLVDDGELGKIRYVYSNRLNFGRIRREENILWSFAPHDISVLLGLLGEMPDSVRAQGGNYLHEQIADVTVSLLSFPSGIRAHLFVSWLHPYKEQRLVVVGERKMAVFDDVEKRDKLLVYPHTIDWRNNAPVPRKADAIVVPFESMEPLLAECRHFVECVRTRQRPRTDGEEALRVLTVLEQCQAALRDKSARGAAVPPISTRNFFAHDSAFIDRGVEIGDGTTIWHVSHVMTGSRIGRNCRIGQNVVIGPHATVGNHVKIQNNVCVYEGVTLEDDVFCGPSTVFTNVVNPRGEIARMNELKKTLIQKGATLGANCTIVCGHTVGRYAFVGAGAVVTHDVPSYALVFGNPARIVGWMCRCGNRLRENGKLAQCPACSCIYLKTATGVEPVPEKGVEART